MINVFKIRKWGGLLFNSLFTTICFFIGLRFYGFWMALVLMGVGMIVSMIVANFMLKTPFRDMTEGKGILVMNLDSTGIIRFSLVGLQSPYIYGKLGNKKIKDVWDRSTVAQIAAPVKNIKLAEKIKTGAKIGGLKIELDEKQYNESRFALFHYPVLIWNDQIESLITKDFLAEKEKSTFAEHGVLFLNRRVEDLTSQTRDFARYVVESTKPQKSIWKNKWVIIIVVVFIIVLALMFAPVIITAIQNLWGSAGGAVSSAFDGSAPITPR